MQDEGTCRLTATIEMSVAVDLGPRVPRSTLGVANAAGSAVLKRVCASSAKKRLEGIEQAYREWSTLPV